MASENWVPVSRRSPCPICDGPDNCTVSSDGQAVWCGRVESDQQNGGGQWLHLTSDEAPSIQRTRRPKPKKSTTDFGQLALECFQHFCASAARTELADLLGVSVLSLDRLSVGWLERSGCWTFPEQDATGNVITKRYRDGKKRQWPGGRRGLTFAPDWLEAGGPVLLVEGASDTAALLSLWLCVVGRPSNTGGVELLAELISQHASHRELIVIGENDRKSHDSLKPKVQELHDPCCGGCANCWPGKFGAERTAEKLAGYLSRPVDWSFPPGDAKDARAWLNQLPPEAA